MTMTTTTQLRCVRTATPTAIAPEIRRLSRPREARHRSRPRRRCTVPVLWRPGQYSGRRYGRRPAASSSIRSWGMCGRAGRLILGGLWMMLWAQLQGTPPKVRRRLRVPPRVILDYPLKKICVLLVHRRLCILTHSVVRHQVARRRDRCIIPPHQPRRPLEQLRQPNLCHYWVFLQGLLNQRNPAHWPGLSRQRLIS